MKTKLTSLCTLAYLLLCTSSFAQQTIIHNFAFFEGSSPFGSLFSDGTFLYGMTKNGGINNKGTIFKIMPDGTGYVKLLDFDGATTGQYPFEQSSAPMV